MARTLELFRDEHRRACRLATQTDRQRRTLETAIETISDGFVLYDGDDRIVLCNKRYREIYPGSLRPGGPRHDLPRRSWKRSFDRG